MNPTLTLVAIDHEELHAEVEDNARDYYITYPIIGELSTMTEAESTVVKSLYLAGIEIENFDGFARIFLASDEQAMTYCDMMDEFENN